MKRRTFLTKSLGMVLAGTAMASLAGCGFHLRGLDQPPLGFDTLTLSAPVGDLTDEVTRELDNAGVTLAEDAPLRVNLGQERVQDVDLTGGDSGSQEYELQLSTPFSVQRTSDNAYLIDQQRLEVVTTYQANYSDLLARGDLREQALDDLRRDAARQLLNRLRSLETP